MALKSQKEFSKYQIPIKFKKALVIGMGQLGLPVATYVQNRGIETYGFDIDQLAIERAQQLGIKTNSDFYGFDVFIICISTHKKDDIYSPDTSGIFAIAEKISQEAKNGALVSIESTVPKGTSRKVFEMLSHRLHVVHVPHRWYAPEEDVHGVNQLRVIGGVSKCCFELGLEFYGSSHEDINKESNNQPPNSCVSNLEIPLHAVPEIEIAELSKIVENSYRYVQIAFVEGLYMYCDRCNIDFQQLREAINTKWNISLPEARNGIRGHCLPKDVKMFLQTSKGNNNKVISGAVDTDAAYRKYIRFMDESKY